MDIVETIRAYEFLKVNGLNRHSIGRLANQNKVRGRCVNKQLEGGRDSVFFVDVEIESIYQYETYRS